MPGKRKARKRKGCSKPPAQKKKKPNNSRHEADLRTGATLTGRGKYKQWTEDAMLGAIRAVSEGFGINRAALEFGLPATSLKDRISGKVLHGCKAGKTPYLTQSEEKELYDYLVT